MDIAKYFCIFSDNSPGQELFLYLVWPTTKAVCADSVLEIGAIPFGINNFMDNATVQLLQSIARHKPPRNRMNNGAPVHLGMNGGAVCRS